MRSLTCFKLAAISSVNNPSPATSIPNATAGHIFVIPVLYAQITVIDLYYSTNTASFLFYRNKYDKKDTINDTNGRIST